LAVHPLFSWDDMTSYYNTYPHPPLNPQKSRKSMHIFDDWLPQKLLEHGDRLVEAALDLLSTYGLQLSVSKRDQAHALLD
jgi:hypothetical protein